MIVNIFLQIANTIKETIIRIGIIFTKDTICYYFMKRFNYVWNLYFLKCFKVHVFEID